ncbi:hypothetical protein MCHI_003148 [Candidatus Magnetoovum chiemensis]|nr:hypothetical protein MCHI_003148 [Candidatus Magnetoovum chiemensis]
MAANSCLIDINYDSLRLTSFISSALPEAYTEISTKLIRKCY